MPRNSQTPAAVKAFNAAKPSVGSAIKNNIIDGVSHIISYPAQRAAQKSMQNADKEVKFIKSARSLGMTSKREGNEIIATPKRKDTFENARKKYYGL